MLAKQSVNVSVSFKPLIIVVFAILIVYLIIALSLKYRGKKVTKFFDIGDYGKVLIVGEKLLKVYLKYAKRYKHRYTMAWIEYLHYAIAISYFSANDYEHFFNHINDLTQYHDIKEFWLSLYYLRQDDFDNAQMHYAKISETDETLINRTYLESFKQYQQGNLDLAKTIMSSIYVDLKLPVLKQIADEIIK